MAPQNSFQPFTAFGSDAPDTAPFNSMMASLMNTATVTRNSIPPVVSASASSSISAGVASASTSTALSSPTTLSTVPSTSSPSANVTPASTNVGSPNASSSASNSAASNAASNAGNGVTASENCHSISCSSGLQAAVAVPVVVGVLGIVALLFFLARRRKRRSQDTVVRDEKAKKKWTRHLRIFSFDTELLGGRFSSSNSMRSGQSTHHLNDSGTQQRENPSLHSVDNAAPPYRDAVSHATHPNMTQTGVGLAAGGLAAGALAATTIPRSESRVGAPPPYDQGDHRPQVTLTPPTATIASANPFTDSHPTSPVDGSSPFGDPSEDGSSTHTRPQISRNSSMRTGPYLDDGSAIGGSEAGSIREAQIGRHISIASGGRTITNVRNSSSSPPRTDSSSLLGESPTIRN